MGGWLWGAPEKAGTPVVWHEQRAMRLLGLRKGCHAFRIPSPACVRDGHFHCCGRRRPHQCRLGTELAVPSGSVRSAPGQLLRHGVGGQLPLARCVEHLEHSVGGARAGRGPSRQRRRVGGGRRFNAHSALRLAAFG